MKDIRHLMNEKLVGNLMKPFIDECGIIHIAYMAIAMFYQRKWLPRVKVEAMGDISIRQKDQEIEELRKELEVYKSLLVDLMDKQQKFEDALGLLRERVSEDSKEVKMSKNTRLWRSWKLSCKTFRVESERS